MVYRALSDIDFSLNDLPVVPTPGRVLLTTPDHFDVQYVINPHMQGNIGDIDSDEAQRQWKALRSAYETLDFPVATVDGAEDMLDMVFCANQTLPFHLPYDGSHGVVLSRMHAEQRRGEVAHYATFFRQQGYRVEALPDSLQTNFEGMGDAIWHPGRYLLWGGFGFRTDHATYEYLAELLDLHIITLRLDDPDFYHLDTCLSVLDEHTALIYPGTFLPEDIDLLGHFFDRLIHAPEEEARHLFACNAHCPDGQHVLIQRGCTITNQRLRDAGFTPVELDTSEFLKAGGSVFCMKQMYW